MKLTIISKEKLEELYINKHKSINLISKELHISWKYLKKLLKIYNIPIRTHDETIRPKNFIKPTKNELNHWINIENKSVKEISKKLNISVGTVKNYMKEFGIFTKKRILNRFPNGYWTKERVTFEILKIQNEKGDLSARYCLKNKGKLFKGALSSYGSWQKAIESAGIDYSTILKQKQWTKNEIINEILELKKQNIDLSNKNIKKIRKDLVQAAENNFGSWAKACISAGLNYYDDIAINKNKYWTKDKIIEEIKKLYNEGYELNSQSMQKSKYKDLFDAGKEKFGSWENAINYAGFNYLEISKLKAQTKSFKEKLHLELPKEKLEELYIKNGFSTIEIGLTYDVSPEVISNLLKKNKISLRKPKYGYNELIVCKDGHKVKSNFERNVDEWLFLNNIEHEYEPRISKERYFKADFKVGRFYIEILGMMEIPKYKKKFEEKLSHFMIIEGEGFIWCKGEDISKYKTLLNKNNKPVYILIIPNKKKLTNKEIEKQLGFLISK